MAIDAAKLTVGQLLKTVQAERKGGASAKSSLAKARKSAQELAVAAKAVAEISKKNPEV